jgi:hypothetical protein
MAKQTMSSPNNHFLITNNVGQDWVRRILMVILHSVLILGVFLFASTAAGQKRDHLTDQETELVRFHQELDKRIEVLLKAIDRRFAIINGTAPAAPKKSAKEEPEWGAPPTGSRTQLLSDIAGILDEAITNIDDVSQRDEKNPLISRSLRKLTNATRGYLNQLSALKDKTKDEDEIAAVERVAENANQILEAGSKLAPPSADEEKKKKKKP